MARASSPPRLHSRYRNLTPSIRKWTFPRRPAWLDPGRQGHLRYTREWRRSRSWAHSCLARRWISRGRECRRKSSFSSSSTCCPRARDEIARLQYGRAMPRLKFRFSIRSVKTRLTGPNSKSGECWCMTCSFAAFGLDSGGWRRGSLG